MIYAELNRQGKRIAKKTLLRMAKRRGAVGLKARMALYYRYGFATAIKARRRYR